MKSNLPAALAFTLKYEGGWSDHPKDPGGATMKGITLATYRAWLDKPVTKTELRNIPAHHVEAIYRQRYWNAVRGDMLPSGYDACMFDYAVNSGPGRALQHDRALPATLGGPARIKALCARRMAFLRGLGTFSVFGRGWTRRVTALEAFCLRLAGLSSVELKEEAAKAGRKAKANATGAAGAAATAPAVQASDVSAWIAGGAFALVAVGVGVLAFKAWQQSERKKALIAEAA